VSWFNEKKFEKSLTNLTDSVESKEEKANKMNSVDVSKSIE
jgi:hypothetical protein